MTKLKHSNCDKTKKKMEEKKPTALIVTKLKLELWQNSTNKIVTKTQKLKLWQISKTQILTKIKLWQNSNTQIVTVVIVTVVTVAVVTVVIVASFSKNNLTPWQPMRCSQDSFLPFSRCFFLQKINLSSIKWSQTFFVRNWIISEF